MQGTARAVASLAQAGFTGEQAAALVALERRRLDNGLCPRCGGPGRDWYVGEAHLAESPENGLCEACAAVPVEPEPDPRGLEAFRCGRWR